jgi:hypothetical protein
MADDLVTLVSIDPKKRQYPHVSQVGDWAAQATIHLLWDRIFDLQDQLKAAQTNLTNIAGAVNTMNGNLDQTTQLAKQAYALAQSPDTSPPLPGDPPSGGDPPCPDDGQAGAGVMAAGPDGHPGVVPLDAFSAGLVIGGTAHEYPLLLAPTIDQPTRDAFMEELLLRMIWHLQQVGFTAGRQRNPSLAISKDKLTVNLGGEAVAYDVFQGVSYTEALPVKADRVCPADYVADPGTPD